MIRTFRTTTGDPRERGRQLGETFRDGIAATFDVYERLFALGAADAPPVLELGRQAFEATAAWAPPLATEIEAIAEAAGMPVEAIAAMNARTEIMAARGVRARGECSTAVVLGGRAGALGAQTWDWHEELRDSWLVWSIEQPNGRVLHTLTELGLLGKIGVSSAGIGLMFNFLRHRSDRDRIGVPLHVLARRILERAGDLNEALVLVASASPSASSALTLVAAQDGEDSALTAEVHPDGPVYVLPDLAGRLVHTNHFVSPIAAPGDLEPVQGPDSFFRYEILRRRVAALVDPAPEDLVEAFDSHLGGGAAICCHPQEGTAFGGRYATLATVCLEPAVGRMTVTAGGPSHGGDRWCSDEAAPVAGQ